MGPEPSRAVKVKGSEGRVGAQDREGERAGLVLGREQGWCYHLQKMQGERVTGYENKERVNTCSRFRRSSGHSRDHRCCCPNILAAIEVKKRNLEVNSTSSVGTSSWFSLLSPPGISFLATLLLGDTANRVPGSPGEVSIWSRPRFRSTRLG